MAPAAFWAWKSYLKGSRECVVRYRFITFVPVNPVCVYTRALLSRLNKRLTIVFIRACGQWIMQCLFNVLPFTLKYVSTAARAITNNVITTATIHQWDGSKEERLSAVHRRNTEIWLKQYWGASVWSTYMYSICGCIRVCVCTLMRSCVCVCAC